MHGGLVVMAMVVVVGPPERMQCMQGGRGWCREGYGKCEEERSNVQQGSGASGQGARSCQAVRAAGVLLMV